MGEDLSTGMKIGISIIILVALISIVFSILTLIKNLTNPATARLQNQMDALSELSWNDYDQKTVTGADLLGFISLHMRDGVSVLVSNGRMIPAADAGGIGRHGVGHYIQNYGVVLDCFKNRYLSYDDDGNPVYTAKLYTSITQVYETDTLPDLTQTQTQFFWHKNRNRYIASIPLVEGSKLSMNNSMGNMNVMNEPEYIYLDHNYKSYLIEDPSGKILGVYFIEEDYCKKKGVN